MGMRTRTILLLLALTAAACGDDDTGTAATTTTGSAGPTTTQPGETTTTGEVEATTTTTEPVLTDPRFPETNVSARFGFDEDEETEVDRDPSSHLALFYRSAADELVVVITGFDAGAPVLECGWGLVDYGPASVLEAESWYTASFDSYGNQPWATAGATSETRCEAEFLEEGELRSDIVTATQCGDYLVVVLPELAIDPVAVDSEVAAPTMELIVDTADGGSLRLQAVPWLAHPGAYPNAADMLEIELDASGCAG